MKYFLGSFRLAVFISHLLLGMFLAGLLRLLLGKYWFARKTGTLVKWRWMQTASRILGLKYRVQGDMPLTGAVWVANHISWLDAVAITSILPVSFIAKSDARAWPLVGALMHLSGTLFIDRNRKSEVAERIDDARKLLKKGVGVAFFPEATTTVGDRVQPFKPSLFAMVDPGVPVQAIALKYSTSRDGGYYAPFVGEMTFAAHLWSILCAPGGTPLDITLCQLQGGSTMSRKDLAAQAEICIRGVVNANITLATTETHWEDALRDETIASAPLEVCGE